MTTDQIRIDDTRIAKITEVAPPSHLVREFAVSDTAAKTVYDARRRIHNILAGEDDRLLVVIGPCSIHDPKAAREYAERLKAQAAALEQDLEIVMRLYFEKPRTTVGWKGLINDPDLDNTFQINKGLRIARELLLDIAEMQLPVGSELLDMITPQYIADLISWGAIGARTTESQVHRELASGMSCPIGFKNGTDGSLQIAINAWQSAASAHRFMGIDENGKVSVLETRGNPHGHVILRGGKEPNYDASHIAEVEAELEKAKLGAKLVVDCSHGNSHKNHEFQPVVARDSAEQIAAGNKSILGIMLESHLHAGNQKLVDPADLAYGVSITDACIDWETTENLLLEMSKQLAEPLKARATESTAEAIA